MKVLESKSVKKISAIISSEFQAQTTHRADFLFFRLANLLELLGLIVIWSIIYKTNDIVRGYTYPEMMTYVTIGWLMIFLTGNYGFEAKIANHIHEGTLTNYLLKPIDFIKYMIIFSFGRTSIALLSGFLLQIVVIVFMLDKIILIDNFINLFIIILMVFFGYFLNLFLSILIGMIAFWTTYISGVKYSINTTIKFLSGRYFPINMLPLVYFKISLFFPFVYIFFMPLQLYLGKISTVEGLRALGVEMVWMVLLYGLIRVIWKKGLKRYEGVGI